MSFTMDLHQQAKEGNRKAGMITPVMHQGIKWEVFFYDYFDGNTTFNYLGSLSSPRMLNYELSREYNPRFKVWFIERIRAYCVFKGMNTYSMSSVCYRDKASFGEIPSLHQMTFPFKET